MRTADAKQPWTQLSAVLHSSVSRDSPDVPSPIIRQTEAVLLLFHLRTSLYSRDPIHVSQLLAPQLYPELSRSLVIQDHVVLKSIHCLEMSNRAEWDL